jgi:hypothetical protein
MLHTPKLVPTVRPTYILVYYPASLTFTLKMVNTLCAETQ